MRCKLHRILFIFVAVTIVLNSVFFPVYGEEFDVDAKSAILMDASTGKILYEKNIHDKLPPASVTKIMTMLLAMEALEIKQISLEDKVIISERASKMGGSQLYLEPNEEKTVEELMKGIALASANDGCVAIAEHISGTEEMFVKRMNERAKELGMNDTQFMNTNGLPQDGHYTSAYDIAIMSKELLKYPKVHDWLTIWMSNIKVGLPNKRQTTIELVNTNKLIRTYPGAHGIKTGYTSEARYCLSASAVKNNLTLIAVILGSPTSDIRFAEAKKLLNYGFASFSAVPIVRKGEVIDELQVEKGKAYTVKAIAKDHLNALVKKGEENNVQKEIILPKQIKAPFAAGEKIGEVIATKDGQEIGRMDIVTDVEVPKASLIDIFGKMVKRVSKPSK
ncbi:D-alanyl-D-alanine carboxypeptidase (penicillin-binding protein 5/6) [Geosporobacter subterraneus DSM 17957]|uniref:serine-type D-Ala-D-Ala carboxypeptidase n=1 Tax=Geosporobacter subterraneus DSM 17957 TaxID=1121919 RepID=A0A1M6C5Y4_9FIRM|nr:D-alanyl-D-alanine carboxypeptidase family protein [Geosporobacter subterraneus]SHI56457.1 D-alanyl-D-alanine carboxypeptidase (penicillin-binding protein 5/6) [Geosporobacter subterraneus DSM 17957]